VILQENGIRIGFFASIFAYADAEQCVIFTLANWHHVLSFSQLNLSIILYRFRSSAILYSIVALLLLGKQF
jgi:hypothetical protein